MINYFIRRKLILQYKLIKNIIHHVNVDKSYDNDIKYLQHLMKKRYYWTIEKGHQNSIVYEKCEFVTTVRPIKFARQAFQLFRQEMDFNATSNPYAYKVGSDQHYSDDLDDGGTAGWPMLSIIEREKLNNLAIITTRYGQLKVNREQKLKAYRHTTRLCLKKIKKIFVEPIVFNDAVNVAMKMEYEQIEPVYEVLSKLEKVERIEEKFSDEGSIKLKIIVENEIFRKLHETIREKTSGNVVPRTYTEVK